MTVYPTRGPINTSDLRFEIDGKHFTIEDCGIPSMFAKIVRMGIDDVTSLFALLNPAGFVGGAVTSGISSLFNKKSDPSKQDHATEAELIDDVFFFNAMGEDDASGKFTLEGDGLDLDWDQPIGNHPIFARIEDTMRKLSQAMGGSYFPLPTWEGALLFRPKTLVITHPLGGGRIRPPNAPGARHAIGRRDHRRQRTTAPP